MRTCVSVLTVEAETHKVLGVYATTELAIKAAGNAVGWSYWNTEDGGTTWERETLISGVLLQRITQVPLTEELP